MKKMILIICMIFGLTGISQGQIIYDDGGTHTIDFYVNDSVEVWDSPLGDITTLNIIDNAIIEQSVYTAENSIAKISGGEILGSISSSHNSTIILEGGEIGDWIFANHHSQIYIYGTDFKIDGISVDYGEIDVAGGTLTGILFNGDAINNMFDINTTQSGPAAIFLVPEPCSLCLFGLGIILLRRIDNVKH